MWYFQQTNQKSSNCVHSQTLCNESTNKWIHQSVNPLISDHLSKKTLFSHLSHLFVTGSTVVVIFWFCFTFFFKVMWSFCYAYSWAFSVCVRFRMMLTSLSTQVSDMSEVLGITTNPMLLPHVFQPGVYIESEVLSLYLYQPIFMQNNTKLERNSRKATNEDLQTLDCDRGFLV